MIAPIKANLLRQAQSRESHGLNDFQLMSLSRDCLVAESDRKKKAPDLPAHL
jgi:hypothetical protein